MIGLSLHGKSVLGVVHAPAQQTPKTYYAVAEKGSFVLPGGEDQCGEGLEGSERLRWRVYVLLSRLAWVLWCIPPQFGK